MPKTDVSGDDVVVDSDGSYSSEPHDQSTVEQPKKDIRENLSGQETRLVWRSKLIFIIALLASAAAVSVFTYHLAAQKEHQEFQNAYEDIVEEIQKSVERRTGVEFGILYDLSAAYTSWEMNSNETWPFVTLPDFERKVSTFIKVAGTEWVGFAPIVSFEDKEEWEDYAWKNQGWIRDGLEFLQGSNSTRGFDPIPLNIYEWHDPAAIDEEDPLLAHVPFWQNFPTPKRSEQVLLDLNTVEWFRHLENSIRYDGTIELANTRNIAFLLHESIGESDDYVDNFRVFMIFPVYSSFDDDSDLTGFVFSSVPWKSYFQNLLPQTMYGIGIDVISSCGSKIYYTVNGPTVVVKGISEEEHDSFLSSFADYVVERPFAVINHADKGRHEEDFEECDYTIRIYPTPEFMNIYKTSDPLRYTMIIVAAFVFTIICFLLYDTFVARRQAKVMATAERTTALVSSLFPEQVQERLMQEVNKEIQGDANRRKKGFLGKAIDQQQEQSGSTRPIADLFPEVTLMFADIVGFTAWSSTREPEQVFTLLETIYSAVDEIAKYRGVFKVETVGDCYVAACGLPTPRKDHSLVMARFARDCLYKVTSLFRELEVQLGPDTADLGMRFGLHSGPVTAGVLRGDRARFQLFGDTMNTAARMEHLGERNKIHISETLMKILTERGKSHWITKRDEKIVAKGKGEMQTYWLTFGGDSTARSTTSGSSADSEPETAVNLDNKTALGKIAKHSDMHVPDSRQERLIDWNTENLLKLLESIAVRRVEVNGPDVDEFEKQQLKILESNSTINGGESSTRVFDEVKEIIQLPAYAMKRSEVASKSIRLHDNVRKQLRQYVQTIASMYRDNPFHNFEHASHVMMSALKLLKRIVAPANIASDDDEMKHDTTYGITSDPLTQFAVVFSALIHDVDHAGVSNMQLVKEKSSMAALYKNRSVLEQNSVDLAWDLLMDEAFTDLREAIYSTRDEFLRFRQLVVNAVMATDIMDKELVTARRARWAKAFDAEAKEDSGESPQDSINRKATIVIEYIIQASDVAHTMQHWHIYRKWNTRLFEELERAYQEGRAEKSPLENWYQGEIGFFDFYIIPLAKKLKDCGVFGVSSDEYLNYAISNREQWVQNGEAMVVELRESLLLNKAEKNAVDKKPPLIEEDPIQRTKGARQA